MERSLASRLLLSAALWSSAILIIAGLVLSSYYRDLVEHGFDQRLGVYLRTLVADLSRTTDFTTSVLEVGEVRFQLPLSGWYWQIERRAGGGTEGASRSSRSLFDRTLPFLIDQDPEKDETATREAYVEGPDRELLRQVERIIQIGDQRYVVAVAGEASEIDDEAAAFQTSLIITFFLLGVCLVGTAGLQVAFGLRPLSRVSAQIADIRAGSRERLEGEVPREVAPLARELNALLDSNRDMVERARTQSGNLAHALKTPLSVIVNEVGGAPEPLAGNVRQQAEVMRQQITHHLDRARVSAAVIVPGAVTEAKTVLESLAWTLERVHRERAVRIDVSGDPARFRGERQDLEEMVGNLLDNAGKWATRRVSVNLVDEGPTEALGRSWMRIIVDDDGPGLTAQQREQALHRGRRLDETKPGSGLGLAIVSELAALYGGSLTLGSAPRGGLRAELRLPAV